MSDRLSELRRQRALLEQHLAWLDREIAAESLPAAAPSADGPHPSSNGPPGSPAVSPAPASSPGVRMPDRVDEFPGSAPATTLTADALLDQYRTAPDTLRQDVRKGCLIYFALAFVALFAAIGLLWFAFRS